MRTVARNKADYLSNLFVFAIHGGAQVNRIMLQAVGRSRERPCRLKLTGSWSSVDLCGNIQDSSQAREKPQAAAFIRIV